MLNKTDVKIIQGLLKGFATKDDLGNFATKNDLKNLVSKDDLEGLVSKQDAKDFATKNDLRNFATKDDLEELAKQKDLIEVKKTLGDLKDFALEGIGNLLEWTNDIHNSIVKEDLPKRVKRVEGIVSHGLSKS